MSEEIEQKAKDLGWKSEAEWKGPPPAGGFVSAEEFVERGERNIGILRENNEKLHAEIAEMRKSVQEISQSHRQAVQAERQRAYERAKTELLNQQKEAMTSGNWEAFAAAREQEEALRKKTEDEARAAVVSAGKNETDNMVEQWKAKNQWFDNDFILHETAEKASKFLLQKNPNMKPTEFLDQMETLVKQAHPDHEAFSERTVPSLDSGRAVSAGRSRTSKYDDLPAEAKAACDKYVKQGLFKSRDDYVRDYFAQ